MYRLLSRTIPSIHLPISKTHTAGLFIALFAVGCSQEVNQLTAGPSLTVTQDQSQQSSNRSLSYPLHRALEEGAPLAFFEDCFETMHPEEVKKQLAQHDEKGNTLLHVAVREGNTGIVDFLLNLGASPKIPNNDGNTPVHLAIIVGNKKVLTSLIKKPVNPHVYNNDEDTFLHLLVKGNNKELIQFLLPGLLKAKLDPDWTNEDGYTPLHLAVIAGNSDVVSLLLKHGVDPDIPDKDGKTPLYTATMRNDEAIVKVLLKYSANPYLEEVNGRCSLQMAVEKNKIGPFRIIMNKILQDGVGAISNVPPVRKGLLLKCCILYMDGTTDEPVFPLGSQCMEYMETLLQDPDVQCNPLVFSSSLDDLIQANLLLCSPLRVAMMTSQPKIIHLLLDKFGVQPLLELPELLGSYLRAAISADNPEVLRALLAGLASTMPLERYYKLIYDGNRITSPYTLLGYAIKKDRIGCVGVLLDYGLNPNGPLKSPKLINTPLQFAILQRNCDMIKFLIERGANVNHEDDNKTTPLSLAIQNIDHGGPQQDVSLRVVQTLIQNGANVSESVLKVLCRYTLL